MAFKMKRGSAPKFKDLGSSPGKQQGPIDRKNPKIKKGEMEGTNVYQGDNMRERLNSLEERASYLKDDLEGYGGDYDLSPKRRKQKEKDMRALQVEADIIRKRLKTKSGGVTGVKPGYTDGRRDKSKDKYYGKKGPLGAD